MKRVRIGNACGFWGDNLDAPVRLAEAGRLDYLTLEYLAELTMSILAVQKAKDASAGYATDIRDKVVSANAYLGARPIADALKQGAEIVVTGRVADASLTVGPAAHEFGWGFGAADLDRLAAGTVAGHLIECGAQVTGGLWIN